LSSRGIVANVVGYSVFGDYGQPSPLLPIVAAVSRGEVDVAVVWGPIAGYFAQRVKSPRLTVVPLKSEPGVRFDYEMAMGVRYGEREWKQKVEGLIDSQQAAIQAILKDYGVPVVDESFSYKK
jgi:ABC-type amino acid transport substrate-binding protein